MGIIRIANVTGCTPDKLRKAMYDENGREIRKIPGDVRLFVDSEIAEGYIVGVSVYEDEGLAYFEMEDGKILKAEENTITVAAEDDFEPRKVEPIDKERRAIDTSDYLDDYSDSGFSDIDE